MCRFDKSMHQPPNLTGINFPCAGLINQCTDPLIWPALISCVPVNKSMHRPPNLTGINFPCAGINCRCNAYRSINQCSVPQLNFILVIGALVSFLGNKHFLFGIQAEEGDTFAESRNRTLAEHRDDSQNSRNPYCTLHCSCSLNRTLHYSVVSLCGRMASYRRFLGHLIFIYSAKHA